MKKSLAILGLALVALVSIAQSASATRRVTLVWNPNTEPDLAGYRIYFGTSSNVWTHVKAVEASPNPQVTLELPEDGTWYFVATARNTAGLESEPSNVVTWPVPVAPTAPEGFRIGSFVVSRTSTVTTSTNLIFVP